MDFLLMSYLHRIEMNILEVMELAITKYLQNYLVNFVL